MARKMIVGGLAAIAGFALVAVLAITAFAQSTPVRVVQGSDGALYLVQGGNAWTLVPDHISDSDIGGLTPNGQVNGAIQPLVLASAPPQPAAPRPAVDKLVRNYNVIYGAQSVVSISGGDGGYTVTASGPLHWKVPGSAAGTGTCDLPDGTVIATFAISGTQYVGHHGIWDASCQFVTWGSMVLNLNGSLLSGNYIGGGPVSFSPTGAAPENASAPPQETAAPSPPDVATPASPSAPDPTPVPDTLTDSMRTDILAAVDRGNAAWSAGQQSLDPADLRSGLTGQELNDDTTQLDQLRGLGQRKKAVNTAFTVLDVSLDSPSNATVHTRETWSDVVYNSATGAVIRQDPATSYSETYSVEVIDGRWIVSQIQLHQDSAS